MTRIRSASADGAQAVGDDDAGAARRLVELALDLPLGDGVERAGRLVEQQDRRPVDQRARQRQPLALAARERGAAVGQDACRSPSASPRCRRGCGRSLRRLHRPARAAATGRRARCCRGCWCRRGRAAASRCRPGGAPSAAPAPRDRRRRRGCARRSADRARAAGSPASTCPRPERADEGDEAGPAGCRRDVAHHQRRQRRVAEADVLEPDAALQARRRLDRRRVLLARRLEHVLDAVDVAAQELELEGVGDQRRERRQEAGGQRVQRQHVPSVSCAVEHLHAPQTRIDQRRGRAAAREQIESTNALQPAAGERDVEHVDEQVRPAARPTRCSAPAAFSVSMPASSSTW